MSDEVPRLDVAGLQAVLTRMGQDWGSVLAYDMVLPTWPDDVVTWTPLRDLLPRASRCYTLPSGNRVHVKPGCRC